MNQNNSAPQNFLKPQFGKVLHPKMTRFSTGKILIIYLLAIRYDIQTNYFDKTTVGADQKDAVCKNDTLLKDHFPTH